MPGEQPVTREAAKAMLAEITRALESGAEETTVNLLDTKISFEKGPGGAFTMTAPGQAMTMRFLPAAASRPAPYPDSVPFVAGEAVTISQPDENTMMLIWWAPRDANALITGLDQSCIADGWELTGADPPQDIPVIQRSYGKAGATRHLMCSGGMVTFIETTRV